MKNEEETFLSKELDKSYKPQSFFSINKKWYLYKKTGHTAKNCQTIFNKTNNRNDFHKNNVYPSCSNNKWSKGRGRYVFQRRNNSQSVNNFKGKPNASFVILVIMIWRAVVCRDVGMKMYTTIHKIH